MDSNSSTYFLNPSTLQSSVYYGEKEENCFIDLGLSLRALQPEAYHHPSDHDVYGDLVDWHDLNPRKIKEDEREGLVQSKEHWGYVKVNMDGIIVGRKVCIIHHTDYQTLALQLEDMFGGETSCGLRLFQEGSQFCLFYKDKDDNWRTVGDVSWKEFVDTVKRLRIVRKSE